MTGSDTGRFGEQFDELVVVLAKAGHKFKRYGLAVVLCIVADGAGIGDGLNHCIVKPIDDWTLLDGNGDQVG